ncbi:hypothetical protein K3495_g4150 [Podosphaera aphanis]|nr:hypothetical protein K3495_g4150 [Podosphaera aphanis]
MSWFSILPPSYTFVEVWVVRLFLLLGTITMGPWVLLLIYDGALYIIRTFLYEIPLIGGRARDKARSQTYSVSSDPLHEQRNSNRHQSKTALMATTEINSVKNLNIQLNKGPHCEDFLRSEIRPKPLGA